MSASERRIADLERELAAAQAKNAELRHLLERQLTTGDTLWFESGVSSRTGEPFVHIRWGDESGQLDVDVAREHALHMLEVTNAAEFDAAFIRGLTTPEPDGPGLELETAMGMLMIVRKARTGDTDASLATDRDGEN
jgi:hypothetical protein